MEGHHNNQHKLLNMTRIMNERMNQSINQSNKIIKNSIPRRSVGEVTSTQCLPPRTEEESRIVLCCVVLCCGEIQEYTSATATATTTFASTITIRILIESA